ncbi:hypothetical protein BT96DRAFT_615979 [Gymnopus androsaceus JB14]|uniref:Uncharacterized protein n=1 Tax=Gymnopus androsaceus JB14 TaxID=1447944 RepID=A0A6A4HRG0_9AGAR|nr:hypothetical protein BT96DRAFT_615979 [Gymnopus androsaceus JB14]
MYLICILSLFIENLLTFIVAQLSPKANESDGFLAQLYLFIHSLSFRRQAMAGLYKVTSILLSLHEVIPMATQIPLTGFRKCRLQGACDMCARFA